MALSVRERVVLRAARMLGGATRWAGRGGGTALPGLLVERAAPGLVHSLAQRLSSGVVLVSGTNGKTTTTRLISESLTRSGAQIVHNRAGSNLMRGIAAALTQDASAACGERHARGDGGSFGLFEVDEATLPLAVPELRPRAVVLLNLFRDQLDRYGEVDTVARLWRTALADVPQGCQIALNADDPLVASLGRTLGDRALYFGLDDTGHALPERERAADFVECLDCAAPLHYAATFYGHLGHYACSSCGWRRPEPAVTLVKADLQGLAGARSVIRTPTETVALTSPLPGLYNQYNLLAAAACLIVLGLSLVSLEESLLSFEPAFGRAERFAIEGRDVIMLLAKNPVGANQVVRLLATIPGQKPLLLALNDLAADGEDVSWIWDADLEGLYPQAKWVVVTGQRAEDLALRFKYAGLEFARPVGNGGPPVSVLRDVEQALRTAAYRLEPGETLYVVPTYTAMLQLRHALNRMGVLRPFWEAE